MDDATLKKMFKSANADRDFMVIDVKNCGLWKTVIHEFFFWNFFEIFFWNFFEFCFSVCYDQSFDIIFIVDGSVRMGRRNYPLMLDWIKDVGENLNLKWVNFLVTP